HEADAVVMDSTGNVIDQVKITDGKGRVCDIDFGPHSIRVTIPQALPVTVSDVRLSYGWTQRLLFVMNPRPGGDVGGGTFDIRTTRPIEGWEGYGRVKSERGTPLPDVQISYKESRYTSDVFGRVRIIVPLREFTVFQFEKAGFRTTDLPLSCSSVWEH